jgi:dTDP-4-dehydrorhamnose reductase
VKILVTGATGQLGSDIMLQLETCSDLIDYLGVGSAQCDISSRTEVFDLLTATQPDVVIHCAAFTQVDRCETEVDKAYLINALGTHHIVEAAEYTKARVVYISTDYVFDGTLNRAYNEFDTANPLSVYGKSKYGGEKSLRPQDLAVRISWVCGLNGANMVKTVLRLALEHETLQFVDDQIGSPTFTFDAAKVILKCALDGVCGTVHLTNSGVTSWCGFAKKIFSLTGRDPERIIPITTEQLVPKRPAPRPKNSVLDNMVLRLYGFEPLPHWEQSLEKMIKELQ